MKRENAWAFGCAGLIAAASFAVGMWIGMWCLAMSGISFGF